MERAIGESFRAAVARRDALRVGPFLIGFDAASDSPYRNYAVPDDGATPTAAEIGALVAAFAGRERRPRLEYLAVTAPAIERALTAAGFVAEGRLPLLALSPDGPREAPAPPGVTIALVADDDDLRAAAIVQNIAYGVPTPDASAADLARLRGTLAGGGIVALARDAATGTAIGAGVCAAPHNGVAEIAAIGVLPAYRRRSVAGALGARLASAALAAGIHTPFLMAEHEAEGRIYGRLGFVPLGEVLLLGLPAD